MWFPVFEEIDLPGLPGVWNLHLWSGPSFFRFPSRFLHEKVPLSMDSAFCRQLTMAAAACGTPGLRTIYCRQGELTYAPRIPADKQRNTTVPVSIAIIRAGHKAVHRRGARGAPPVNPVHTQDS